MVPPGTTTLPGGGKRAGADGYGGAARRQGKGRAAGAGLPEICVENKPNAWYYSKADAERKDGAMDREPFMREALTEAEKAAAIGEVPVGAVVVRDGAVIGRGHNRTETDRDPVSHAEILAIRDAAKAIGGWRLTGCDLYVTTEPCSMCAGAIVLARIRTLCIGTMDPKAGACGSLANIPQDRRLNHYVEIETGILEEECRDIMKEFFRGLRRRNKAQRAEPQEDR